MSNVNPHQEQEPNLFGDANDRNPVEGTSDPRGSQAPSKQDSQNNSQQNPPNDSNQNSQNNSQQSSQNNS